MAYKRQIDRLPIIPADAREFNVTCHYCIVGCGYKAYTWPVNKQGGTAPSDNKFGVDLSKQQQAETAAWYAPAMYNIVRQNGQGDEEQQRQAFHGHLLSGIRGTAESTSLPGVRRRKSVGAFQVTIDSVTGGRGRWVTTAAISSWSCPNAPSAR